MHVVLSYSYGALLGCPELRYNVIFSRRRSSALPWWLLKHPTVEYTAAFLHSNWLYFLSHREDKIVLQTIVKTLLINKAIRKEHLPFVSEKKYA